MVNVTGSLLEAITAGAFGLTQSERTQALANLERLPRHKNSWSQWDFVELKDVGLRSAGSLQIYGVTARDKKAFIQTEVDPRSLCYSQHDVAVPGLLAYINNSGIATGDPEERWAELPLVVVNEAGNAILISGHTRVSVQILAGRSKVRVEMAAFDPTTKRMVRLAGTPAA